MFKEKVGEIFIDLSMNLSKTSRVKALQSVDSFSHKVSNNLKIQTKGWGSKLKSGFFSTMEEFLALEIEVYALNVYNNRLKETVNYFNALQSEAGNSSTSFEEIQELKMVTKLGKIDPTFIKNNSIRVDAFLNNKGLAKRGNKASNKVVLENGLEKAGFLFKDITNSKKEKESILNNKAGKRIWDLDDVVVNKQGKPLVEFINSRDSKKGIKYNPTLLNTQNTIEVNTGKMVKVLGDILNMLKGNSNPKYSKTNLNLTYSPNFQNVKQQVSVQQKYLEFINSKTSKRE